MVAARRRFAAGCEVPGSGVQSSCAHCFRFPLDRGRLYHFVIYSCDQLFRLFLWALSGPAELNHYIIVSTSKKLAKADFEALSEFRYQLRRFLRFSEQAAESEGLTPQQYLLLLHLKGMPGRETATVGELAERLQMLPHGALALVNRCETIGLILREESTSDRRQVLVSLTAFGEERLRCLAALHRAELQSLDSVFQVAHISAYNNQGPHNAAS